MSRPLKHADLKLAQEIAPAPALNPNVRQDIETRHFDLPVAIHAGFFGLFLAYLGVMFIGFYEPQMILPMAIFVIFTVGFYVVPAMWARVGPDRKAKAMSMQRLLGEGIATHVGWCNGRDAVIQALILPVLILGWGIAVVSIAALV